MTVSVSGWVFWSGQVARDVGIGWSSDSPACEGTKVREAGSQRPVVVAQEGMRCVIEVQVTNDSGYTVRVVDAAAPFVGPATGTVVTAQNAEPAERGSPYDVDAFFPLDRSLPAGESTTFDIVLVIHPSGCNTGTLWVPNWPTVTVDTLGRSHEVHGDMDFALHSDGTTPGCLRE